MMTAEDVIAKLDLKPLPGEGGFYNETFRSAQTVFDKSISDDRNLCAIAYYLITPDQFSILHSLRQDEIWHFYAGCPAELVVIDNSGTTEMVTLGCDLDAGHSVQHVVPAGRTLGVRLVDGGKWTLFGMTTAPGFDFRDVDIPSRATLIERYPTLEELIRRYTIDR